MSESLIDAVRRRVLVGDGAMGTQLQLAGLEPGGCGEEWNLSAPDRILAIQSGYVAAGADCLLTNTFGGCSITLRRHGLADQAAAINAAAVRLTRRAFGDRAGFVIGDIGPFGGLLEPFGEHSEADVSAALGEQAAALVEAGADAVLLETQTAFEEIELGVRAARGAGAPCVIVSMAFDSTLDGTEVRTMMGIDPDQAAARLCGLEVDIVAINCGTGVDGDRIAQMVRRYRAQCDRPVMTQPNAGQPELRGDHVVYCETPEQMAHYYPKIIEAGARIVGACCGSTPEHIRAVRQIVDTTTPGG